MTAHATLEERQRCLAAGMDDHVSKPIDPELLYETVARHARLKERAPQPEPAAASPAGGGDGLPSVAGLDAAAGLGRVGGNRKLFAKLLSEFAAQQSGAVAEVEAAVAAGEGARAERLAHSLKGVAANLGMAGVAAAAGALEQLLRGGARGGAALAAAKREVRAALDPAIAGLKAWLGTQAPEPPAATAAATAAAAPAATVDPAATRAAAAELMLLLAESDPGAADLLEAKRQALLPLFPGAAWERFEGLVQGYALDEARVELERAVEKLGPA
jgi:HPt (histidine-containing phosphotransfer) domain-containing protein